MGKKNDWGFLVVFLLFPLYSIPAVFCRARKCDKVGLLCLCLFFAVLSFLIWPNYDATNHGVWDYYAFNTGNYWDYHKDDGDFFLAYLAYIVLSLGLSYQYVIFICVLLSAFAFWTIYYKVANNRNECEQKILFRIFFLLYPFVSVMCGLRYYLGVSFLMLGAYMLFYERNIRNSIIIFSFVLLTHFSLVVQVILVILAYFVPLNISRKLALFMVVLLCSSSIVIVNGVIPELMSFFSEDKVEQYADSEYREVLVDQNMNFYIAYYIKKIAWTPFMLLCLFFTYNRIKNTNFFAVFIYCLFLWGIGYGFIVMEGRWGIIACYFFFIAYAIYCMENGCLDSEIIKWMCIMHSVRYFLQIHGMKFYLSGSSHLVYLLYMPYPLLLTIPYNQEVYQMLHDTH